MTLTISEFAPSDADAVNALALSAFEQYRGEYADFQALARNIGNLAGLADSAELIVARLGGDVVGAVAYVGPGLPKHDFFKQEWPIVRMLVVLPSARGHGVGRALTEECLRRARRDGAPVIALHTSPIMKVALPMYLRMGFQLAYEVAPILGVPYAVYTKDLGQM